jgi:tight adherence protein C
MILTLILGVSLAGLAFALALRGLAAGRTRSRVALANIGSWGFATDATSPAAARDVTTLTNRLALRVGTFFQRRLGAEGQRELRTLLNSAGLYKLTVTRYLGYRGLAALGLPAAFVLLGGLLGTLSATAVVLALAFGGLSWYGAPFLVKRKARLRLEQIDYEVPELVDLLVTTVEAGVGFAGALQLSARRTRGALGEELRLMLREQSMGLTPNESLANLLARADSPALRAFVQAILQGETLGVSIGKILRDLAVDMRKRRRQAAEERAQKAPVKLLFPLVVLIMPAMFIVILGPAVYAIVHSLAG